MLGSTRRFSATPLSCIVILAQECSHSRRRVISDCGLDPTFEETREDNLIVGCLNGVEEGDAELFATACSEFDEITKLDSWSAATPPALLASALSRGARKPHVTHITHITHSTHSTHRTPSLYTVLGQILDPLGVQELAYDVGRLDVVDRPDVLYSERRRQSTV